MPTKSFNIRIPVPNGSESMVVHANSKHGTDDGGLFGSQSKAAKQEQLPFRKQPMLSDQASMVPILEESDAIQPSSRDSFEQDVRSSRSNASQADIGGVNSGLREEQSKFQSADFCEAGQSFGVGSGCSSDYSHDRVYRKANNDSTMQDTPSTGDMMQNSVSASIGSGQNQASLTSLLHSIPDPTQEAKLI